MESTASPGGASYTGEGSSQSSAESAREQTSTSSEDLSTEVLGASTQVDSGSQEPALEQTVCPFDEELQYEHDGAYPFCQWENPVEPEPLDLENWVEGEPAPSVVYAWQKYCPPLGGDPASRGMFVWHGEEASARDCQENGAGCNACVCAVSCNHDTPSGCPTPETGKCLAMSGYEHKVCAWSTAGERCNEEQLSSQ